MKIFKKWIEKNSQKSEIEKKGVAIFYSFLITLVIFMIWAVTLFGSFNIDSHLASSSQKKAAGPIDSLIANTRSIFNRSQTYDLK